MNRSMCWVAVLAALLSLPNVATSADPTAASSGRAIKTTAGQKVGVVDINRLFFKHAKLSRKLRDLQAEAGLIQARLESDLRAVSKNAERLKDLTMGTPEYKTLDKEIAVRRATVQTEITMKRKEFVERETLAYYGAYQEIMKDVQKLAKSQHLSVVLNVNRQEVNASNPDDVARTIKNEVVWFDDSIDLTPLLEENYSQCPAPAAAGQQTSVAAKSDSRR